MKNDKLALQLKLLNRSLLDRLQEVSDLQYDIRPLDKEKSEEVSNIINGINRDSLMIKDNIGRVRRKLFN